MFIFPGTPWLRLVPRLCLLETLVDNRHIMVDSKSEPTNRDKDVVYVAGTLW